MKAIRAYAWSIKVAGLVVLVASFAGVALFLHPRAQGSNPEPTSTTESPTRVICFGHVDVDDGVAALYPLQPGQVREIAVKEGATVHARNILIRLDRRQAEAVVRQAQADLAAANTALKQARRLLQLQPIREAEQQAVIDAATARVRAAEAVLGRRQEVDNLAGSAKETEAARDQRDEVQAVLRGERKKLEELRLNDPSLTVARAEANVAAKKAQLDQATLMLEHCDLRAPADGTVLRVLVKEGEVLGNQPKQPAVWFCPKVPPIIRAEVDQEFGYRVSLGQSAVIKDDSSAGPSWHGKVYRISDWYTHRRSILVAPLQLNDVRTLECLIAVEPGSAPLRIGQRVLVTLE